MIDPALLDTGLNSSLMPAPEVQVLWMVPPHWIPVLSLAVGLFGIWVGYGIGYQVAMKRGSS